nr:SOS response-associated peptidase [Kineococcus sp. TRM81007]
MRSVRPAAGRGRAGGGVRGRGGGPRPRRVRPSSNVAPTSSPPVVLERFRRGEPDAPPARSLRSLRWGLVPSWAKDASGGPRALNARAETLLEKPSFAQAALARRCLVPADAWYEWQVSPVARDGAGGPRKQPFAVRAADGSVLSLAGVYEFWQDPAAAPGDPARWLVTFAVVTTAAEPGLDRLHERMPLLVPRDLRDAWLDPTLDDAEDVAALLAAVPRDQFATALTAHPVPRAVGDVRQDGPHLLEEVPEAELEGVVDLRTGQLTGA